MISSRGCNRRNRAIEFDDIAAERCAEAIALESNRGTDNTLLRIEREQCQLPGSDGLDAENIAYRVIAINNRVAAGISDCHQAAIGVIHVIAGIGSARPTNE